MNCPRCDSNKIIKNGRSRGKQRYRCKNCDRSFQQTTIAAIVHRRQRPKRVLILLTSHRSGSTWLSDAIRCHPAIEYHPTSLIYEELGLYGRRYPGDLSNQSDCTYKIEVQPKKFERIPQFNLTPGLNPKLKPLEFIPYGIEKCHPSFFDFKSELFLEKIAHLESLGIEVKLVCLVRDPKSLITSFINYQKRKPAWYKNVEGEKIVTLISDTFNCILQVLKARSPLVFDYADLKANLPQVLRKIYQELWFNLSDLQLQYLNDVSHLAQQETARQQRVVQTNSPFLGQQEGNIRGGDLKYSDFFTDYEESLERSYREYQQIVEQTKINQ